MKVHLEINRSTLNRVRIQLDRLGLATPIFLSWKQAVEFNLSEDPQEMLMFITRGADSFHEYQVIETVANRKFKVTWEAEWIRSTGRFHILDVTILERSVDP